MLMCCLCLLSKCMSRNFSSKNDFPQRPHVHWDGLCWYLTACCGPKMSRLGWNGHSMEMFTLYFSRTGTHLLLIILLTIRALFLGQDILNTVGPGHGIRDNRISPIIYKKNRNKRRRYNFQHCAGKTETHFKITIISLHSYSLNLPNTTMRSINFLIIGLILRIVAGRRHRYVGYLVTTFNVNNWNDINYKLTISYWCATKLFLHDVTPNSKYIYRLLFAIWTARQCVCNQQYNGVQNYCAKT